MQLGRRRLAFLFVSRCLTMGLTRAERGRLAALADELATDDPRLARALAGRYYRLRRGRRRVRAGRSVRDRRVTVFGSLVTLLALAAVAVVIIGALLGQPLTAATRPASPHITDRAAPQRRPSGLRRTAHGAQG
jgi:hypothetical protein